MPFTGDTWVHDPDRPWEDSGDDDGPGWGENIEGHLRAYFKLTPEERVALERKRDRGGK